MKMTKMISLVNVHGKSFLFAPHIPTQNALRFLLCQTHLFIQVSLLCGGCIGVLRHRFLPCELVGGRRHLHLFLLFRLLLLLLILLSKKVEDVLLAFGLAEEVSWVAVLHLILMEGGDFDFD